MYHLPCTMYNLPFGKRCKDSSAKVFTSFGKVALWVLFLLSFATTTVAQNTYEQCVEQGLAAAKDNKLDEAEEMFRKALKMNPDDYRNALLYGNLAHVQEVKNEPMKALTSYDYALNIAPLNVPLLKARANLYMQLGNYNKAAIDYGNIIDVDPKNIDALLNRAFIFQQRRDYQKAKEDYERLLTIEPDNYTALLGVAILFQNAQKPQEALSRLALLIDKYPDKAELYSIRAEIEAEAKQTELAIIDLNKAIELDPENKNMILTRAYIHLEAGHKHLARQDFERAISLGIPRGQLKEELKKVK